MAMSGVPRFNNRTLIGNGIVLFTCFMILNLRQYNWMIGQMNIDKLNAVSKNGD